MTISIIGFGRFGKIVVDQLNRFFPQATIVVATSQTNPQLPKGVKRITRLQAAQSDVVIPCVPISAFENVIKDIAPHLKKDALVVDVCSVKAHPVKVMKRLLPKTVSILATHPLFGPESLRPGLKGNTTVIFPVRIPKTLLSKLKAFAKKQGHRLVVMTPEKHDQLLARSQALTHLFGRLNHLIGLKPTPIDTAAFKALLKIQPFVINDSEELFQDMFRFNPHAMGMLGQVKKALTQLEFQINPEKAKKL